MLGATLYYLGKGIPSAKWFLLCLILVVCGLIANDRLPAAYAQCIPEIPDVQYCFEQERHPTCRFVSLLICRQSAVCRYG